MQSYKGKLIFSPQKIATITCIGRLYDLTIDKKKTKVDLIKLCNALECNNILTYVKYFPKNGTKIEKGIPRTRRFQRNIINRSGKKKRPDFSNASSLDICISPGRTVNVKICLNGTLQITGIKKLEEKEILIGKICEILSKFAGSDFFSHNLSPVFKEISMIIYNTCIVSPSITLDNSKLRDFIIEKTTYYADYENEIRSLELLWGHIAFYIFQSGKINITALKSFEEIDISYNFITNFLNEHIDNFIMSGKIEISLSLLKRNETLPVQRSPEWISERKKCITASDAGKAIGLGYGDHGALKSRNKLIHDKALAIANKSKPFCNAYMEHGTCYEPIAIQLYTRGINMNIYRGHKVLVYSLGMFRHEKYPFIGASIDGLVFMFPKNLKVNYKKPFTYDELVNLNKEGKILDTFLIEIKCPSKYKIYDDDGENIKCINGYVPPYYWFQMQQQLAVCSQKHCDFVNNYFTEYETEQDFICDTSPNYRGILIKYYDGGIKYLYPQNVVRNLIDAKTELLTALKGVKYSSYEIVYWRMEAYKITEVDFDEKFFNSKVPEIERVYNEAVKLSLGDSPPPSFEILI